MDSNPETTPTLPPLAAVLVEWSRINQADSTVSTSELPKQMAVLRNGMRVESGWFEQHNLGGKAFLVTTEEGVGMEVLDPDEIIFIAPTGSDDTETTFDAR